MGPDLLPRQETFLCVACSGPTEFLPSFLNFKDVGLHSLKDHMVALERAVQASTLLPNTLITFVCKLCPSETVSHFLTEEELKIHMGKHSEFFVDKWKEFSEVQCRICEIVIDHDSFEDHMSKAHSRNLFADPKKVEIIVENKEEDYSQKLICNYSETQFRVNNDQEKISSENDSLNVCDKRSFSQQPKPSDQGIRLKPIGLLLDQSKKQHEDSPACFSGNSQCLACMKAQVDCGQCSVCRGGTGKMFIGERCLYVCQCKEDNVWSDNESESVKIDECSKPANNWKLNELKTNQLLLIGIKKHISAQNIKNHFSRNGVQVADVVTVNGSGKVTFVEKEDAEAWTGKVVIIDNCHIRISNKSRKSTELRENEVSIMKIPKAISVDDLHEFFSNEGFDIADITIQPNGCGKVLFRNRKDAAYWEHIGRNFIVKGIQMPLYGPSFYNRRKPEPSIEVAEQSDVSVDKPIKGESCSKAEVNVTSSSSGQWKESSSNSDLSSKIRRESSSRTGESYRNYSDVKSRREGRRPSEGHVRDRSRSRLNRRQKTRSRERSGLTSRGGSRERSRSRNRCGTRERSRFVYRDGSRDRSRSRDTSARY